MVPVAECAAAPDCQVLSGQRVSLELGCLDAAQPLACGTTQGCLAEPTRATDAGGQDWVFPSSCLPASFTDSTSTGTRFDDCSAP
jgi:hypothetical protein